MIRKMALVGVVVMALLATALPAKACSCAQGDPRDMLADSDAAFIGTLLSKTVDPESTYESIYTFQVEEEVKGALEETVDVRSASNGAACGLEVPIGGRTGLFLSSMQVDGWRSHLCLQIDPERLRAAAEPLPEPDGEGPIRMLVSGTLGEVGIVALDNRARTLGYGMRDPSSGNIEVCPKSLRFIELSGDRTRPKLAVRDTATLEVVEEVELPLGDDPYTYAFPAAMACHDQMGKLIHLAAISESDVLEDYIFQIRGQEVQRIYRGHFSSAHFDGPSVFITEGQRGRFLVELNLLKPERDGIATVPRSARDPRLSPNGKWIVFGVGGDHKKLVRVHRATGRVRVKRLTRGHAGEALWLSNRRIALLPGGDDRARIRILSRRLGFLRLVPGEWYTSDNFIRGRVAYGIGWGVLYRARLPGGTAKVLRRFESPTIYSITPVNDEVHADPSS